MVYKWYILPIGWLYTTDPTLYRNLKNPFGNTAKGSVFLGDHIFGDTPFFWFSTWWNNLLAKVPPLAGLFSSSACCCGATGGSLSRWLLLDRAQMPCRSLQVHSILYRRDNFGRLMFTTLMVITTRLKPENITHLQVQDIGYNSATHHLPNFSCRICLSLLNRWDVWDPQMMAFRAQKRREGFWLLPCIRWARLWSSRIDAEGCEVEHSFGSWNWCNVLPVYPVAYDAQEHVLLVGFLEAVDLEDLG